MNLNTLWFILIAVLYIGYFILEGFDFGVGVLLFTGKSDKERRMIINTIGPHWDGNEVWLITAGGATFAAFPDWYATLFSGFYLPLFLMLVALIVRGVAFEFRSKDDAAWWRKLWDWMIFIGSFVPAVLWGVAFANFVRGVPVDETMTYVGGFFNLLNPYALVGGLTTLGLFTLQGALFLSLKVTGQIRERAENIANKIWLPVAAITALFGGLTYVETDILEKQGAIGGVIPVLVVLTLIVVGLLIRKKEHGLSFALNSLAIALFTIGSFVALFPRVLVSSLDPAWSLTIDNAASSPTTLKTLTTIALIFIPLVLAYQAWSYWVFRKRITSDSHLEY